MLHWTPPCFSNVAEKKMIENCVNMPESASFSCCNGKKHLLLACMTNQLPSPVPWNMRHSRNRWSRTSRCDGTCPGALDAQVLCFPLAPVLWKTTKHNKSINVVTEASELISKHITLLRETPVWSKDKQRTKQNDMHGSMALFQLLAGLEITCFHYSCILPWKSIHPIEARPRCLDFWDIHLNQQNRWKKKRRW